MTHRTVTLAHARALRLRRALDRQVSEGYAQYEQEQDGQEFFVAVDWCASHRGMYGARTIVISRADRDTLTTYHGKA